MKEMEAEQKELERGLRVLFWVLFPVVATVVCLIIAALVGGVAWVLTGKPLFAG